MALWHQPDGLFAQERRFLRGWLAFRRGGSEWVAGRRAVADGNGDGDAIVEVVRLLDGAVRVDDEQQGLALVDHVVGADIDAAAGGQGEVGERGAGDEGGAIGVEDGDDEVSGRIARALVYDGDEEAPALDDRGGADDEVGYLRARRARGGRRLGGVGEGDLRLGDGSEDLGGLRGQLDDDRRPGGGEDERGGNAGDLEVLGVDPTVELGLRREDDAEPVGVGGAGVDLDVAA